MEDEERPADFEMTDEQINEIEARANAAQRGPWTVGYPDRPSANRAWVDGPHGWDIVDRDCAYDIGDAEFIAHSRADVPALIAALREARAVARDILGLALIEDADIFPEVWSKEHPWISGSSP